jgi:hypothetical protein
MMNEQANDVMSTPWAAVLENCFQEFMQFYFPAAENQINWMHPVEVDDAGLKVLYEGKNNPVLKDVAHLLKLLRVQFRSGKPCRILVYIGWEDTAEPELALFLYQIVVQLNARLSQATACFVVLAGEPRNRHHVSSLALECLGSQFGAAFPCVYFADFESQQERLRNNNNAFALLSLAQIIQKKTQHDMAARYANKWSLIQSLFGRRWTRERINLLFLAIDWSLPLSLRWSQALWKEIEMFEEQQVMRYVSSVELFVREREWQQGCQRGELTMLQHMLARRFGELPLWVGMQLQNGSGDQRIDWLERGLVANSLEDVFSDDV